MTALVTGATGFVGSAVLRALLHRGHEVRALVRPDSDRSNLAGLDVDLATGDLCNPSTLPGALAGCDTLFHVAADYRLWVRDADAVYRTNVDGTAAILRAAAEAGVRRIVYTSSVATLGLNEDGSPADENTPVSIDDMIGHYKRSKFLAEQAALKLAAEEGVPVVIVNPSAPVGPRDSKPTPTGRMVLDAAAGRMPAYVDSGLNIVHVDDVAQGHLLACEHGRIGERYILGEANMTLREIFTLLAALNDKPAPRFRLPHGLTLPLAYGAEAFARITGGEPLLTVDGARLARKAMFFSSAKARRELSFRPRPGADALRDAVEWFRNNGYL